MTPLVSIIVPVYNVENYLEFCVNSLIRQTLKNIEIILVDDGSPDKSPKICDNFIQKDSRIKVIHKRNEGLGMARNSGLKIASGKYVMFIDSDDYIDLNTVEILYTNAIKNNLDLIGYKYDRFTNEGPYILNNQEYNIRLFSAKRDIRNQALYIFIDNPHLMKNNEEKCFGSACTILYKRELIKKYNIKFHSERNLMSEDYIFNYDFLQKSNIIGYIPIELYHYRNNNSSLTNTYRLDRIIKAVDFCQFIENKFISDYYSVDKATFFSMSYFFNMIRVYFNFILCSPKLTWKEKKEWYNNQIKNKYFTRFVNSYKLDKDYPLYLRISLIIIRYRLFLLQYFFSKIYQTFRTIKI